jgi:hypothetical protein
MRKPSRSAITTWEDRLNGSLPTIENPRVHNVPVIAARKHKLAELGQKPKG